MKILNKSLGLILIASMMVSGFAFTTNAAEVNGNKSVKIISKASFYDDHNPYELEGNELFVEYLYSVVLNREPDETGFNYWVSALQNGYITPTELAKLFFNSEEFLNLDIDNSIFLDILYCDICGRTYYTESESNYWITALNNGATRSDVIDGFLASHEWDARCELFNLSR